MAKNPDVLETLLAAKWRDVEFPTTKFRMSVAHELVHHKYWGVDGARVEDTGLEPIRFTFSVPMLNGIKPGRKESWADLYPTGFRKLLISFQKHEKGTLQHPEFGPISCKADRFDADWTAERRGGADVELSFVETLGDSGVSGLNEDAIAIKGGTTAALAPGELTDATLLTDLDALLKAQGLPPRAKGKHGFGLDDLFDAVRAVTDYPTLLSYQYGGKLNAMIYQAKALQASADRARSATTWPITQNVERMKAAAREAQKKILEVTRTISKFTVPATTTLAGVARQVPGPCSIADLISLNPTLMRAPTVRQGTIVRYYKSPF